jgi:hypothetical protein
MNARSRPEAASESVGEKLSPTVTPWEPSLWFRTELARVEAAVRALPDVLATIPVVLAPLGHSGPPGSREDRTCDRCRKYIPPTDPGRPARFFVGGVSVRISETSKGVVTFGLCDGCHRIEGSPMPGVEVAGVAR